METVQTEFKIRTKKYRGLQADVYFSEEDGCYVGRVIGIRDIIAFTAHRKEDIEKEFKEAVDDYFREMQSF
jgi:predicted HicB family RNase H-like nuclease